jgi:hypothetical protein
MERGVSQSANEKETRGERQRTESSPLIAAETAEAEGLLPQPLMPAEMAEPAEEMVEAQVWK